MVHDACANITKWRVCTRAGERKGSSAQSSHNLAGYAPVWAKGGFYVRVLLIEDEVGLAGSIRTVLKREGYIVDHISTVADAREAALLGTSDAVLLDRSLPDGDGIDVIDDFRRHNPGVPIIVITARAEIDDRVAGLDCGADDYLTKPFAMAEMLARLRAVRRRPAALPPQQVQLGELVFDMASDEALVKGMRVDLPRRELRVLAALMQRRGRTVRRAVLEDAVYGFDDEIQSNSLDAHVSRLRKRLAESGAMVEIHAVRGVGYLLRRAL